MDFDEILGTAPNTKLSLVYIVILIAFSGYPPFMALNGLLC